MAKNLFSVPIFFIVFRETLEAAIIVSVLLGLAEQIVHEEPGRVTHTAQTTSDDNTSKDGSDSSPAALVDVEDDEVHRRRLVRKLRIQARTPTCSFLHIMSDQPMTFRYLWGLDWGSLSHWLSVPRKRVVQIIYAFNLIMISVDSLRFGLPRHQIFGQNPRNSGKVR